VTAGKAEVVLAVLLMVVATLYLQAMVKGKKARTWAGFLGALLVFAGGFMVFLLGLVDLGKAVPL